MTEEAFAQMRLSYRTIARALLGEGLSPVVYGSFALYLHAGRVIGNPKDVDLAFRSRDEHDRAVAYAQTNCGFSLIKQFEWDSEGGDRSVNTILRSPEGISFDFSYSLSDLDVSLDPQRTIDVDGRSFPILSLEDIRRSYERFADEKPDTAEKLAFIDELLRTS